MRSYLPTGLLLAVVILFAPSITAAEQSESNTSGALTMVVMDPLAAPLSCPCVKGYAQRDYTKLASYLSDQLGREVRVGFGGSLIKGQQQCGGNHSDTVAAESVTADIVIGKDSVVRSDVAKLGGTVRPHARLSGRDGKLTQTGLVVVCTKDPAKEVANLKGYRILFGPADSDEKHAAAIRLVASQSVPVSPPTADNISGACSDGASLVVKLGPDAKVAAVISSYAHPLLEGCGTIQKGDLRVVGETEPVAFVTAFTTNRVDEATAMQIEQALLNMASDIPTLQALESMLGFMPIDEAYQKLIQQTTIETANVSDVSNVSTAESTVKKK